MTNVWPIEDDGRLSLTADGDDRPQLCFDGVVVPMGLAARRCQSDIMMHLQRYIWSLCFRAGLVNDADAMRRVKLQFTATAWPGGGWVMLDPHLEW